MTRSFRWACRFLLAWLVFGVAGVSCAFIDPELDYLWIRPARPVMVNNVQRWEPDVSVRPKVISIALGAKQVLEAKKLTYDFDAALVQYIGPELELRGLCSAGYRIRPGDRSGTKRGSYSFKIDCLWKSD